MLNQTRKKLNRRLTQIVIALAISLLPVKTYCAPGDLYETDLATGTIFKFAPDGTQTTFASGLIAPVGLAFDGKGNTFIGDTGGGAIIKVAPDGTQTPFATIPDGPTGLAFDGSGNLFVAVFNTGVVLKITAAGVKSAFASGLSGPGGIVFDSSGNLIAADNVSGMIDKITPEGIKSTFASGIAGAAGVVFDRDGNLFVASNVDGTIFKFTPNGTKSTFASGLGQSTFLAFEPLPQKLLNASARAFVQTGDNALIAGFIVGGSSLLNNLIVIRAIGPSLSQAGVANPLPDPKLELHDGSGALIASNDNWQETKKAQILASGLAPADAHESVILTQLPAGGYTAIVRSANDATGIALVEIYNAPTDANPQQSTILRRMANRESDDQTNPSPRTVLERDKNRFSQATLGSKLAGF